MPAPADRFDMMSIEIFGELQMSNHLQHAAMITSSCIIVAMI
jgi:hypothetical protein